MPAFSTINSTNQMNARGNVAVTPGATVTMTLDDTKNTYSWTAGENETVNASGTQNVGQAIYLIISNDATLGRVITFGTGFVSNGVVTGVISKKSVVHFISDGTNFIEVSRTVGI